MQMGAQQLALEPAKKRGKASSMQGSSVRLLATVTRTAMAVAMPGLRRSLESNHANAGRQVRQPISQSASHPGRRERSSAE